MTTRDYDALFPGRVFLATVLQALDTKIDMSGHFTRRFLQRAAMAGIIVGVLYVVNYAVIAEFDSIVVGQTSGAESTLKPIGRLLGSFIFGFALIFIYYTKSELLTSNMMIVSIGRYFGRTTVPRALRVLSLCFVGNILGGLFIALPYRFSTIIADPTLAQMVASVDHKLAYIGDGPLGWLDLLARATMCNFMINLAMLLVYNGLIKSDGTKCAVMIMSVFIFAFLGFEHSVANSVLFTIVGLVDGIAVAPAIANVAICLVGNFLGGGILIGLYYAWVNDERGVTAAPSDS